MRYFCAFALLFSLLLTAGCDVMASTRIEQAVLDALAADARTSSYTFDVSHQGEGRVLITGEVYSAQEVEAVSEIAQAVQGVTQVLNRVTVEEQSSGLLQDEVVPSPFL